MESSESYSMVILPLFIFFARICDVSLGTLRIIFISKGYKNQAALISFFEILIWIVVITRVIQHIDNWINYLAYAGGFATGSYVGMLIEQHITLGYDMIRIITRLNPNNLIQALREEGFGITALKGNGMEGEVGVIYVIIQRKHLKRVTELIRQNNPHALYTIEDIRYVSKSIYYKIKPTRKIHRLFSKK
ncbi:MAG TPA: DUF2179 domain-containing protein [Bacteroidales bacterium]|nr:DUF2179 domain-containing protein [Bacteroidales bacterium]